MDSLTIKDIENFFYNEDDRREFMESIIVYKDKKRLEEFLIKIKPYIPSFNKKSKLFYCYLWIAKTNLNNDELSDELLEDLVPELRIYESDKSAIRMGSRKRYNIKTNVALSLARKHYKSDIEFSKWLNNAIPSYNPKTIKMFYEYQDYYPFFNKKLKLKLITDIFLSTDILEKLEEFPDFELTKDILNFEKKNRFKIIIENSSAYCYFIQMYKINYLSKDEMKEIFNFVMDQAKEVSDRIKNNEVFDDEVKSNIITRIVSFFSYSCWRFVWDDYINSKNFEPFLFKDYKPFIVRIPYSLKNQEFISRMDLRDYLVTLGFGEPKDLFYSKEDFYGITNKKEKFLRMYGLEKSCTAESLTKLFLVKDYQNNLFFGMWINIIPFEAIIYLKEHYPFFISKNKDGLIKWSLSAAYLFVDYFLYSNEELELTQELKQILEINHAQ